MERARIVTESYRRYAGMYSNPVMRATAFRDLCEQKAVYIGSQELIVGQRGPRPKAVPTYPEISCHTQEDLEILDSREKTPYRVDEENLATHINHVEPYWRGRSIRERILARMSDEWLNAYSAGIFTEFMEQRAPGHTAADGKIYRYGMVDLVERITRTVNALDLIHDPHAWKKREQLLAMKIAAESIIILAHRYAAHARALMREESDPARRGELERIAAVCERVPAHAPRNFHEAIQMYWFCHIGVILELNGWDAYTPGHLDQHLDPFLKRGLADGSLTRHEATELLQCLFIQFNNHPAPPKVGVTAAESGTYTDFASINLGGITPTGFDGVSQTTYMLLEIVDELHLVQPNTNIQLSTVSSNQFLRDACAVIRKGYGFPSVFNADMVIAELLRQGKSIHDAREGGTSGCVEAGAFGKEAYILTGYLNLPKILELTLHNGMDFRMKKQLGPETGSPDTFECFDDLFVAWERQARHFIDLKIAGNHVIEGIYAETMPAPFLSLLTDDCIEKGLDYNQGGARYNTSYIQAVGIGSLTDAFAGIKHTVYDHSHVSLRDLVVTLDMDFRGNEPLRQRLLHKTPKWGNDDDRADTLMHRIFEILFDIVEGQSNGRGGCYHIDMLPTTCHIYFGAVTGATPDGRHAGTPLSEGISPVQGMDQAGPTAVIRSASKMDHVLTGGTLLNMKFTPDILAGEEGIHHLASLIRSYFLLGGHHLQFNVVHAETLKRAQAHPEDHRDLIVRVAGYSDYFCDLGSDLQNEIISRTVHSSM